MTLDIPKAQDAIIRNRVIAWARYVTEEIKKLDIGVMDKIQMRIAILAMKRRFLGRLHYEHITPLTEIIGNSLSHLEKGEVPAQVFQLIAAPTDASAIEVLKTFEDNKETIVNFIRDNPQILDILKRFNQALLDAKAEIESRGLNVIENPN